MRTRVGKMDEDMSNERKNEIWRMLPDDFRKYVQEQHRSSMLPSWLDQLSRVFGKENLNNEIENTNA